MMVIDHSKRVRIVDEDRGKIASMMQNFRNKQKGDPPIGEPPAFEVGIIIPTNPSSCYSFMITILRVAEWVPEVRV